MRCLTLSELPPPPPGKTGWPWTEESPQLPVTMPNGRPWPRVSIVTPSYNQGQFIEGTIRSVLLQDYPNLEYIIIDGESTDGSVEIIKRYERWLAFWISEPDRGQSDAINKGFSRANGQILAWLNSDDLYEPGAVSEVVDVFLREPDVALVYGTWRCMDSSGQVTSQGVDLADFHIAEAIPAFMNCIPQPSAFIRRAAVERVGMLDPGLELCMDFDLWVRVAMAFPVRKVERCWSMNVVHDATKSRSQVAHMSADFLRCVDNIFSSEMLPPELACRRREAMANAHLRTFWMAMSAGHRGCAVAELLRAFLVSPRATLTSRGAHRYYSFVLGDLLKSPRAVNILCKVMRGLFRSKAA